MCSSRPLTSHLRVSTVSLRQMFGLCLACFGVLLLPMDVANRNSAFAAAVSSASGMWGGEQGEALPMTGLWEIVLVAIVIMVLGVIPFAIFYYEESGEGCALSRSVS